MACLLVYTLLQMLWIWTSPSRNSYFWLEDNYFDLTGDGRYVCIFTRKDEKTWIMQGRLKTPFKALLCHACVYYCITALCVRVYFMKSRSVFLALWLVIWKLQLFHLHKIFLAALLLNEVEDSLIRSPFRSSWFKAVVPHFWGKTCHIDATPVSDTHIRCYS